MKPNGDQEVIEISSGDESEHEVMSKNQIMKTSKKRSLSTTATGPPNKRQITENVVEVLDSDDEPLEAITANIQVSTTEIPLKFASNPNQHIKVKQKMVSSSDKLPAAVDGVERDKDGRFVLSQKVKVDVVEKLTEVPARWPIPPAGVNTAYVIDLNDDKKWCELDMNSKKKRLDRFVKQEVCLIYSHVAAAASAYRLQDQDSWGHGTNGTTARPTPIRFLDDLPARRSVHQCNGAKCCEMFDQKVLHGYIRDDAYDMTVIQEIFAGEQKQNNGDGATAVAMSEMYALDFLDSEQLSSSQMFSFYRLVEVFPVTHQI